MFETVLRRATIDDAEGVADVYLRSFEAALPTVRRAHTDEEIRHWIATQVVPDPARETWVAEAADGSIVGMMVLSATMLEQLYLVPDARGAGLGDRFVHVAKARRPEGLTLYAFQVNLPARRFYERHGFLAVEFGDGAGNEEREPDVLYAWTPGPVDSPASRP